MSRKMGTQGQENRELATRVAQGSIFTMGGQTVQNIVFSAMVALGCWGFAIFCIFFYSVEPNHYLYGALMAATALIWSIIAARRWSAYRQRA